MLSCFSCEQNDVIQPSSNTALLAAMPWTILGHGYDLNNNNVLDVAEILPGECNNGNQFVFAPNGIYNIVNFLPNCVGTKWEGAGYWALIDGESKIAFGHNVAELQDGNNKVRYPIVMFTNTQLTFGHTISYNGQQMKELYSFSR